MSYFSKDFKGLLVDQNNHERLKKYHSPTKIFESTSFKHVLKYK